MGSTDQPLRAGLGIQSFGCTFKKRNRQLISSRRASIVVTGPWYLVLNHVFIPNFGIQSVVWLDFFGGVNQGMVHLKYEALMTLAFSILYLLWIISFSLNIYTYIWLVRSQTSECENSQDTTESNTAN